MATCTRINTFVDQGTGRADQWMADAALLRDFIAANVQDIDGTSQFSAAPVLSGGDPGSMNQAARKAYLDTKLKLEAIVDEDQGWTQPDAASAFPWFWQGGVTTVTTAVYVIEYFTITYPIPFAGGNGVMAWFTLAQSGIAEICDNFVNGRWATGFTGFIGTAVSRTVDIAWLALGPGLVDWNSVSL